MGDMALLDPERAQRLQPVGRAVEFLAGFKQRRPQHRAEIGAAIDLIGALAGKRQPRHDDVDVAEPAATYPHDRQRRVGNIDVDHLLHERSRFRPGNRHAGPLLRHRGQRHLQRRPVDRQQEFQMRQHAGGVARRRRHQIAVVRQPPCRAVVIEEAVVAQHQAVARLADRQGGEGVGVDPVQKGYCVRSLDIDLAERRDIGDADGGAHRPGFADRRLLHTFARLAIDPRPLPQADIDHVGAGLFMAVMHRRAPERLEVPARCPADNGAEADRRIGRPEARRADLGDRPAVFRRHDRQRIDIGGAALIGRHAERRVAFEMLRCRKSLAPRQPDIACLDVVLQVDKGFAAAL